jgi:hypothetical protein
MATGRTVGAFVNLAIAAKNATVSFAELAGELDEASERIERESRFCGYCRQEFIAKGACTYCGAPKGN